MQQLRTPVAGCPWDLEQNFKTIAPYTIEEAYEVADAIARNDFEDLKDELGDLLLQVVYHARMAEERPIDQGHEGLDPMGRGGLFEIGVVDGAADEQVARQGAAVDDIPEQRQREVGAAVGGFVADKRDDAGFDNDLAQRAALDFFEIILDLTVGFGAGADSN